MRWSSPSSSTVYWAGVPSDAAHRHHVERVHAVVAVLAGLVGAHGDVAVDPVVRHDAEVVVDRLVHLDGAVVLDRDLGRGSW